MRLLLGCAMVFLVICFVGCGTSSPSPCEVLKNQARQQHLDFSAKALTWADQAKTRSRPPSEIQEETLREATRIRAWFLEKVFGVEDIDATQSFPETMGGCSGSGLRELRGIGTMEMNFLDSIIAEYKKPLRGKREGQRRAQE